MFLIFVQYLQRFFMNRREQKSSDRYNSSRNKLSDYLSKQIPSRTSKHKNSRIFSNTNKTSNLNSSQIYSQPQIISQQQINKARRGASIMRNNSKSKYSQSMGKFRKEFIKDGYVNFEQESQHQKKPREEPQSQSQFQLTNGLTFDQEIGVEQLHYQMVKLHQNVKKIQYGT